MMSLLRLQTRTHHDSLEKALDLLSPPLSRARFTHVIQRFFGFHRIWEPAVAEHEFLREFHLARRQLAHLRGDLLTLGVSLTDIESLPLCYEARACASDPDEAVGSMYVIEGSTLGGQIISRMLAAEEWPPAGGFRAFNRYGANTGQMWRAFAAFAETKAATGDPGKIVTGARRTFDLLTRWLPS